jgi:hypothetical protein
MAESSCLQHHLIAVDGQFVQEAVLGGSEADLAAG